jgi:hypothetical protein
VVYLSGSSKNFSIMLRIFKSQERVIREIHNEFDTAQDNLLRQAKEIIHKSEPVSDKGKRLLDIGFTNSEAAVSFKKNSTAIVENKEQAELIEYYKRTYPFNKFITEKELQRICAKYKMVFAPVSRYIKDVPEKNVSDIEKVCKLKDEDVVTDSYFISINTGYYSKPIPKNVSRYFQLPKEIEREYLNLNSSGRWNCINKWLCKSTNSDDFFVQDHSLHVVERQGLFICAPKSHFKLEGLKKKGLGFLSVTIFEVKDPIVFRYVRGGVQIITKWGLEASDSALLNDIDN